MKTKRVISCLVVLTLLFLQVCFINVGATSTSYTIISSNSKLESRLVSGWKNLKASINIEDLNISVDYLNKAYFYYIYNNPEYFYVQTRFEYKYTNNKVLKVIPSYTIKDSKKITKMKNQINKQANKILKGITKDMSSYDKCLYIHDSLTQHTSYKDIGQNSFNLYGPLIKRYGVCQGYVCAYTYLLKKAGITATAVTSKTMNHAWNKVKIGNNYYHVDVTYDDAIYDKSKNIETTGHTYFLLSDSEIASEGHVNWVSCGDKKCDKKYSVKTKVHQKALNAVFCIENKYYYIDKDYDLVRENKKGKKAVVKSIGTTKKLNLNGVLCTVTNLPKIVYYKGKLYFNDCEKVYTYNLTKRKIAVVKTLSKRTLAKSSFISDLSIKANGKLYYGIKNYNTNIFTQKNLA